MADIKRIMSKKKPTAKDTLTVLLYDLTQRQAGKQRIDPEEYKSLVLRLSNQEREKHEKNSNLYNFLFSLPEQLAEKENRTALLIQFLEFLLLSNENITELKNLKLVHIFNFIDMISENIRTINGYNYLISCLEEYAPDSNLKKLYVSDNDIKKELKNLRKLINDRLATIETDPNLEPFLNLFKQDYNEYNIEVSNNVKEQIRAAIFNDLEGFTYMAAIENTRYLMESAKEDD